uniref:Uncharacterized protein n=1 Tax=Anguilla anguilla TaxID=7936 RepID=A0A0E9T6C6_ANGAN
MQLSNLRTIQISETLLVLIYFKVHPLT